MPLSNFKRLDIREIQPTYVNLQMNDRSFTYRKAVIDDVLINVNKFIFPIDFIILDMDESREILLILGIPFLATCKAIIDVQKGELTMRI
ncbi:hypothetical protein MA16_Dca025681 [Dendrobium catenatum]|uniref:Uncharacterized protein n=1 Tax=Dendrobium catenatum TaxID=906689 RepID=A0A2I0VJ55_9ASPA|nr:hypothetical protein MA16_Dca025681 [Dendrobium catenatum]